MSARAGGGSPRVNAGGTPNPDPAQVLLARSGGRLPVLTRAVPPNPVQVLLAQCVVYLARAPKSVEVYSAYSNVKACLRSHQGPLPPVPLHLRNAPTRLMKDLGYGQGYKYNPAYSEPVEQEYLPQELRGVDFFKQRRC